MIRVRIASQPRRAFCFDLENRPLAYWYDGHTTSEITAFAWKWRDEPNIKSLVLRADGRFEWQNGRKIGYGEAHERFASELTSAGLVYGHNIIRHDLPLLQAWRLRLGSGPLPELLVSDTCRHTYKTKDISKSLEALAATLDIPMSKHKLAIPDWERGNQLVHGTGEVRLRVESDVLLQEMVRERMVWRGQLKEAKPWRP